MNSPIDSENIITGLNKAVPFKRKTSALCIRMKQRYSTHSLHPQPAFSLMLPEPRIARGFGAQGSRAGWLRGGGVSSEGTNLHTSLIEKQSIQHETTMYLSCLCDRL